MTQHKIRIQLCVCIILNIFFENYQLKTYFIIAKNIIKKFYISKKNFVNCLFN